MKKLLSRMFNSLPKRLAAGALVALAIALPVAATAADMVKIEADTTVGNSTTGANWSTSTNASYNDVVAVQVVYDNTEPAGSGKTATNLHVKINIPSQPGTTQTITTKVNADNSNTVNGSATVNLNRSDAYLQYIPGTATWKHASTINGPQTTIEKISDDVVLGANGVNLQGEIPCQAGSVVVQARVLVPGLTVDKFVRHLGDTTWSRSITANPGDTLQYEIAYHNTGNTDQNNVEWRDQLPKGITYVPGSTMLKDGTHPNGWNVPSDALVTNGITTGTYAPGAAGYVMFNATVANADQLACGNNLLRNIAFLQPEGMNYYYNTADVNVNKTCVNTPVYSCDAFGVTTGDNRTVTVNNFKYTASNGATFSNVVINWGDQSQALTTNNAVGQTHQYAADGTYTLSAVAHFQANGQDVTATGNCTQTVTFTTPGTPPVTPPTTLVNTGAGDVIGIFAATAIVGAFAHRLFLSRRLSRQ